MQNIRDTREARKLMTAKDAGKEVWFMNSNCYCFSNQIPLT